MTKRLGYACGYACCSGELQIATALRVFPESRRSGGDCLSSMVSRVFSEGVSTLLLGIDFWGFNDQKSHLEHPGQHHALIHLRDGAGCGHFESYT